MVEAKAKAKAKPKKDPEFKKPWPDAVLVKFLARTRRTAPSPSQKSLKHCGTQGYGIRKPGEVLFVDKADANRRIYKKLTPSELKAMLPQEPAKKEAATKK